MSVSNIRLIICGFALLLFGILIALVNNSTFSYIPGSLGLLIIIISCSVKDEKCDK